MQVVKFIKLEIFDRKLELQVLDIGHLLELLDLPYKISFYLMIIYGLKHQRFMI
jgi:hypothetical protein